MPPQKQTTDPTEVVTTQPGERTRKPDSARSATAERVAIPVGADGRPVGLASMRESTRDKLRTIYSDPEFLTAIGATGSGVKAPTAKPISLGVTHMVIGVVGEIIKGGLAMATKAPAPIIEQVAAFDLAEVKALEEPAQKVLTKYLGARVSKYEDELELAGALVGLVYVKLQMIRELQKAAAAPKAPADILPFVPPGADAAEPTPSAEPATVPGESM